VLFRSRFLGGFVSRITLDKPSSIAPTAASHPQTDPPRTVLEPPHGQNSTNGPDEAEIRRRRLLALRAKINAGTLSPLEQAQIVREAGELQRSFYSAAAARAEAAQLRERERERPAYGRSYRPAHEFDPGEPPKSHAREAAQHTPVVEAAAPELEAVPRAYKRKQRHRARPWKAPRRKPKSGLSEHVLRFGADKAWSVERKHRLAVRTKKNDAIIAHPSSAAAAMRRLCEWSRAAVLRCLRGEGWTLADEAGRRHVSWWATQEEFAVPRRWTPRKVFVKCAGMVRFPGMPKYAMCVVGWTQGALAIAMSGAAYSCEGADPIDPKTVGRHTALAEKYGGIHVVRRNPEAEAHLRGAPTDSNPRGWPINEYWLPSPQLAPKPGFFASPGVVSFGLDGTPIDLAEALAIELTPRRKWRQRRLLELQQATAPPQQ